MHKVGLSFFIMCVAFLTMNTSVDAQCLNITPLTYNSEMFYAGVLEVNFSFDTCREGGAAVYLMKTAGSRSWSVAEAVVPGGRGVGSLSWQGNIDAWGGCSTSTSNSWGCSSFKLMIKNRKGFMESHEFTVRAVK